MAEEDYIRRVFYKKVKIKVENFRKIAVVDLFENGTPKSTVDLQLVEQAEDVVATLLAKFKGQITFFDNAPLVMTVQRKNKMEECKRLQQRLAKEKKERQKAREAKKNASREKREKKREANLREARKLKLQKQIQQKLAREQQNKKRRLLRKRTREIKSRVVEETTAKAAKIQRVALETLSEKHQKVIDELRSQHQKEIAVLQQEISTLNKKLEDSNRRAEHQKLLSTIESLTKEVTYLRRGQAKPVADVPKSDPENPVTKVPATGDVPKTAPEKTIDVLARALERVNSAASSSSSSSGALTPLDPDLGTPYDPLAPVFVPPMRRSSGMRMTQLGGGYDYFSRQVMNRSMPARRRLDYRTPQPPYGGFDNYF